MIKKPEDSHDLVVNKNGKPWVHWRDRPDASPFDTMEQDKAQIARLSSPFTAFLRTAKSLTYPRINASSSLIEQDEIYNDVLDAEEKVKVKQDLDRKFAL